MNNPRVLWVLASCFALSSFSFNSLGLVAQARNRTAELQLSTTEIARRHSPSVVVIEVLGPDGRAVKQGSGVMIADETGWVVTNFHVINGACNLLVRIPGYEKSFPISVLQAANKDSDLALLQIDFFYPDEIAAGLSGELIEQRLLSLESLGVRVGRHVHPLQIGDKVVAIGTPMGLSNTVTEGIVSGFRRLNGLDLIRTSVPISHGSSGGALFDSYGTLVGITEATLEDAENINFAIPTSAVMALLDESTERQMLAHKGKRLPFGSLWNIPWNRAAQQFCEQPSSSSAPPILDGGMLVMLIGSSLFDTSIQQLLMQLNDGTPPVPGVTITTATDGSKHESRVYNFPSKGVGFSAGDGVVAISTMYVEPGEPLRRQGYVPFKGILPLGLMRGATRYEVLARLGMPSARNAAGDTDKYIIGNYAYFLQFDLYGRLCGISISVSGASMF